MDFVYIDRRMCKILKGHALSELPNECIGFFEAAKDKIGNIKVTLIQPCRNISRNPKDSGDISKKDVRKIQALMKKNEKHGFIYGMYHSHPSTGTVHLSEKDIYIGKIYKRFRHQIIAGVYGKKMETKKVRLAFWFYRKPRWFEADIMIKRSSNA